MSSLARYCHTAAGDRRADGDTVGGEKTTREGFLAYLGLALLRRGSQVVSGPRSHQVLQPRICVVGIGSRLCHQQHHWRSGWLKPAVRGDVLHQVGLDPAGDGSLDGQADRARTSGIMVSWIVTPIVL